MKIIPCYTLQPHFMPQVQSSISEHDVTLDLLQHFSTSVDNNFILQEHFCAYGDRTIARKSSVKGLEFVHGA